MNDPKKASTYIYRAFENKSTEFEIDPSMQNNISRHGLIDMMTFDRVDFEKTISLSVKKKVKIESKWGLVSLGSVLSEQPKSKIQVGIAKDVKNGEYLFFTSGESVLEFNDFLVDNENIYLSTGGNAVVKFYNGKAAYSTDTFVIKSNNDSTIKTKFIFYFLESIIGIIDEFYFKGLGLRHLQKPDFRNLQIPLPPIDIQQKIVTEIENLEIKENRAKEEKEKLKEKIISIVDLNINNIEKKLGEICEMKAGKFVSAQNIYPENKLNLYPCYGGNGLRGYTETYTHEGKYPLIGRQGALCGNVCIVDGKFHATEHAVVVTPMGDIKIEWLYYKLINLNLNQFATGTAQPGLSVENIKKVKVSVPPISEQQKIVVEIEKIEAEIAKLETELATIPTQKEAILKKYL